MLLFYIPSPMLACIMLNHFYSPNRLYIHLLWVFTCDFFFFFFFFFGLKQLSFLWEFDNSLSSLKSHFNSFLPWLRFTTPVFPQEKYFLPLYPCCSLSTPWQLCHFRRVALWHFPYTVLSFRSESRSLLNLLIQLPVKHPTHDVSSVNVYSKL